MLGTIRDIGSYTYCFQFLGKEKAVGRVYFTDGEYIAEIFSRLNQKHGYFDEKSLVVVRSDHFTTKEMAIRHISLTTEGYLNSYYSDDMPFMVAEADRIINQFETDTTRINGVVRWKSNNRIPPDDVLNIWEHVGKVFDRAKCVEIRDEETAKSIEDYRRNYRGPSREQMAEMRAEFGPGHEIVNVITGTKFRT